MSNRTIQSLAFVILLVAQPTAQGQDAAQTDADVVDRAMIRGNEAGWQKLTLEDFENANCKDDTWSTRDGVIHCNGNCVGVIRSKQPFTNFELTLQWRHLRDAGNSGVFLWSPLKSIDALGPNQLPHGIEVQVLDLGYKAEYEKSGRKADWFTCHGDVFPVGASTMKPFEPVAPNGRRSFPSGEFTKDTGQWNHYYVRAINGEVRLWVNGHEVSGGTDCKPATGYLALEAEGAPIEFRNLRLRILP